MATGTGKTRTCIGLIYRLLKTKRFRRVLFLVDRTALGEQTADAFKEPALENLQTFTDIFDVKELGDIEPDADTRCTSPPCRAMVKRVLVPHDRRRAARWTSTTASSSTSATAATCSTARCPTPS